MAVTFTMTELPGLTLLKASGYVVADRKSAVASKLTGRLVFLGVEEGSRVQAVVQELRGERIDVIAWSNAPERFIASALTPAEVVKAASFGGRCSGMIKSPRHSKQARWMALRSSRTFPGHE